MDTEPSEPYPRGRKPRVPLPACGLLLALVILGAAAPPPFHAWPLLAGATILLLISGTLSAFEAALFSTGSEQMDSLERQGRHGVISARALLTFRDETLMTMLVLDHVLHLGVVICLLMLFSHVVPGRPWLWATLGSVVSAAAILVVGEYLPRALGRRYCVPLTLALSRPLVGLTVVAAPIRWLILTLSNALLGLKSEQLLEHEIGNEEELKTLLTGSDLRGGLEEDERELIDGVVEFGATRVGEIMTPRPELYAEPEETPQDEMLRKLRHAQFSRVLIHAGALDEVRGILHVKDLLLNPGTDYRDMLRKTLVVPESKSLMDLLREFRRRRVHLALVCDEFGRTVGVVTMHDLLEEIVGELTDEHRPSTETIRSVGPNAWMVSGRAEIHEMNEKLGMALPEVERRTISGFVTSRLERIPTVGDTVEVPA